jgi:hypothetical protein
MLIDEKSNREKLGRQKEAIYHIIIKGKITATLRHVVENMQIRQDEEQEDVVNLVGYLPDQSALLGLLNALDDIRHEILSVRILSSH